MQDKELRKIMNDFKLTLAQEINALWKYVGSNRGVDDNCIKLPRTDFRVAIDCIVEHLKTDLKHTNEEIGLMRQKDVEFGKLLDERFKHLEHYLNIRYVKQHSQPQVDYYEKIKVFKPRKRKGVL